MSFFYHQCVLSSSLLQPTAATLRGAIQLGIGYAVGNLSSKPDRDVLMQDFSVVESVFLPRYVLSSAQVFFVFCIVFFIQSVLRIKNLKGFVFAPITKKTLTVFLTGFNPNTLQCRNLIVLAIKNEFQ